MKKLAAVIVLSATVLIANYAKAETKAVDAKAGNIPAKTVSGPAINIPETDINLGTIPRDKTEVVGEIVIFNIGDKLLKVLKVNGTCYCFAGYSGDEIVQPGASGVIQAKFDKNKIPAGNVVRTVEIETNDPANAKVTVGFHFTVDRDPIEEQLLIISHDVAGLREEVAAMHRDMAKALASAGGNQGQQQPPDMQPDTNVYDINIASSPMQGPADAPVTIVLFSDFQCPFCVREYPKIRGVMEMYKDKVKLVFKHYPLPFHEKARPAHAAAQFVFEHKGLIAFWKMHDMIMLNPDKIDSSDIRGYVGDADIALGDFDAAMDDENKMDKLLSADMAEAKKCNVTGTPTVLINGLKMQSREINDYKKRIDQILAEAKDSKTEAGGK
jgi:protein-disulfide isomerase